ncbi:MAG TPA: dicarboxylate/amino acid:cation symporter [Candidatus Omnitrophota bacterium]|nr:dicarboxylate/amino acid:cation symporter [Candidatus Omnitrophota bacterium]
MKKILKNYAGSLGLIAAVIGGVFLGRFFPQVAPHLKPIGTLWLNLIFTAVVPLVFFSISATVAQMTDAQKMGRVMGWMLLIFVATGILAALFMLGLVSFFPPSAPLQLPMTTQVKLEEVSVLQKLAESLSTGDFMSLFSRQNMLALIVFSGLLGAAVFLAGKEGDAFRKFLASGNAVMLKMIRILMAWAPLGLLAYFADLASRMGPEIWGTYADVLKLYYPAAFFYFFVFSSLYTGWAGGLQGVREFWLRIPAAALTAFGTGSSLATVPANLKAADEIGVKREVSEVVIPVGATIHMDGSCLSAILKISILFAIFNQPFYGFEDYAMAIGVALLSGIVMSGVPGGGFLGEMMIVSLYGFPAEALPVIAMVGALVDPPATMVNSTGDTAASMMVSRLIYGKKWRTKSADAD